VTQEIDRTLEERHLTSTDAAQRLNFAAAEAGAYVVEGDGGRSARAAADGARRLLHGR